MAVNKTPNLGLHDWLGTEYVKREEIVENFRKIDNEFGASGRVGDLSNKIGILSKRVQVISIEEFPIIPPEIDDTARIKRAHDSFPATGGVLVFSRQTYIISDEIKITKPISIIGSGQSTVIQQKSWGYPVFRVQSDDVTIDQIKFLSTEPQVDVTQPVYNNGDPERDHCVGIYGDACNRLTIGTVWVDGFVNGVTLRGADTLSVDNRIINLTVSNVSFGLLASAQKRLKIGTIRGTYKMCQTNLPPHLVYFTKGGRNLFSEDVEIDTLHAWDGADSLAVQFKGVKYLQVNRIKAHNCHGVLSLDAVEDSQFNAIQGTSVVNDNGIYIIGTNGPTKRVNFDKIYIDQTADFSAIGFVDNAAEDCFFADVYVRCNMTSSSTSPAIYVRGTKHRFQNVKIQHLGAAKNGLVFNQGSKHQVDSITTENCGNAVIVETGVTNCIVKYEPDMLDTIYAKVLAKDPSTKIIKGHSYNVYPTRTGNPQIYDPNGTDGLYLELSRTDTNAITINNPPANTAVKGMELIFVINNQSAGTIAGFTWGTSFVLTGGTFTSPAAGKKKMIKFIYDGANWVETYRSGDF